MSSTRDRQRRGGWLARVMKRALHLRSEDGGALLEFAVTLPLYLSVITGAASFTLAFYNLQELQSATAGAAQAIAAEDGTILDPCSQAMTMVQAALPGWTASKISYNLSVTNAAGTATAYPSGSNGGSTGFTCTAAGANGSASTAEAPNEAVVLTVTYTYTWLPILSFSPSSNLTASQAALAD